MLVLFMLKSFITAFGSLLFAIFFLLILQLDWRGQTLESHFSKWLRQSSMTAALKEKSKILQKKINKKIVELKAKKNPITKELNSNKNQDRLEKLTDSIKKKFKRSVSNNKN
ncbi:MAG: hypothetical protein HAW60_00955 [Bdellovibrionales bacterium]|nr:hypothetical protein [Bdellovibrionales bacterium]